MDRFNKRVYNAGLGGIYNNFGNLGYNYTRNSKQPVGSSIGTDVRTDNSTSDIHPPHVYNTSMTSSKKRKQKYNIKSTRTKKRARISKSKNQVKKTIKKKNKGKTKKKGKTIKLTDRF